MENNNQPATITVAFVDDHTDIMRHVANQLQTHQPGTIVTFIAGDGEEMKANIERHGPPLVVVMDVQMYGMDGYEATEWLAKHHPDTHIIAYSAFVNAETISDMLHRGARAVLAKGGDSGSLAEAIREITTKGYYLNAYVNERMLKSLDRGWLPKGIGKIPERRRQVLDYCHEGLSSKEIAVRMGISIHAIGKHFRDLFKQFEVNDRSALISKAKDCGLLPPRQP